MTADLGRRMAARQIAAAAQDVARDADRLAATAAQYAADIRGGSHTGDAWQLAQAATDLLRQAARLDGMRDVAGLMADDEPKETTP